MPSTVTLNVTTIPETQQFTATAKDQYGNPMTGIIFAWSSSNGTVGTVDAVTGLFTANAVGTTNVTATNGTVDGTATVTVVWLPGDINGDGVLDYKDGPYLVKHELGSPGFETICADGDVNNDGVLDYKDGPYLVKHELGIPGFENIY